MSRATATLPPELGTLRTARLIASDIKLAHSVFALPFAVLAAFLAGPFPNPGPVPLRRFLTQLALIVVCMVLARTWAMVVNRLADRTIDARNARTRMRPFASGALSTRAGIAVAGVCALLFCAVTSLFWLLYANFWPLALSLPVLAWIAFYSFTKRFTALCHVFLGGALAASPLAATIAIDPVSLGPPVYWLAGFVLLWVAGFDVIYALQDRDFDRSAGLHSVPARLGSTGAAWVSRLLHGAALASLVLAWESEPRLGALFGGAMILVGTLLIWEHVVVSRALRAKDQKPALNVGFFTLNGIVSCVLGVAGCLDSVV